MFSYKGGPQQSRPASIKPPLINLGGRNLADVGIPGLHANCGSEELRFLKNWPATGRFVVEKRPAATNSVLTVCKRCHAMMAPVMRACCLILLCLCYLRFSVSMDAYLLPRIAEIPPLRTLAAEAASKHIGAGVAELVVNASGWSATVAQLSTDQKEKCRSVCAGVNGPFVSDQDVDDCLRCVTDTGSCSSSSGSSSSLC